MHDRGLNEEAKDGGRKWDRFGVHTQNIEEKKSKLITDAWVDTTRSVCVCARTIRLSVYVCVCVFNGSISYNIEEKKDITAATVMNDGKEAFVGCEVEGLNV